MTGTTSRDAAARTLAAIDVGTVSTRLIVARVWASGEAHALARRSTITNLGQGVDATGRLDPEAVARTLACVRGYGALMGELAAVPGDGAPEAARAPEAVTITLTSAARDAENAADLTGGLRALGLEPQVIPGEVEARLSLLGVTGDFPGTPILMADSGGGSTELALGLRDAATGALRCGRARSFDVGCRRVTERFFGSDPARVPAAGQVEAARAFARAELGRFFAPEGAGGDGSDEVGAPRELVCVGGTATSLVSVANELVPYDPSFVHLHRMSRAQVSALAARLLSMGANERRGLPGLQPKRADVIAAGALILDELLAAGGFGSYVASERDSLFGLLACELAAVEGAPGPLAPLWEACATDAAAFERACAAAG